MAKMRVEEQLSAIDSVLNGQEMTYTELLAGLEAINASEAGNLGANLTKYGYKMRVSADEFGKNTLFISKVGE